MHTNFTDEVSCTATASASALMHVSPQLQAGYLLQFCNRTTARWTRHMCTKPAARQNCILRCLPCKNIISKQSLLESPVWKEFANDKRAAEIKMPNLLDSGRRHISLDAVVASSQEVNTAVMRAFYEHRLQRYLPGASGTMQKHDVVVKYTV